MRERFPSVYTRGPLTDFTFKERIIIRVADAAFYLMIRLIGSTLRYSAENEHLYDEVIASGRQPILAFWHDRIFAGVYYFRNRNIAVLTSKSMDGEYIARFISRFGYGAVRGSSSRGGMRALVEMIKLMREGVPMAFTVDGPRGPRYEAKSGPVLLAKKTGNPIVPFVTECSSYWQMKSWDRLQIPRPFSRARIFFGEPIYVADTGGEDEIEQKRLELQQILDDLVRRGKAWGDSLSSR
jgi:lysophospholipid acyltransferase (LPLAT)-like uncharacterized protein